MKTQATQARWPLAGRIPLTLLLMPVALFCGFGFLATFEQNEPAVTWTFRLLYAVIGLVSALASCRLLLSLQTKP